MRRKYKLFLIIIISVFLAYFIYIFNKEDKIYLVSLGDGVSSGQTAYNIDGISYNDYLKEHFYVNKLLKNYNKNFSKKNYKLYELINDIDNNKKDEKTDLFIKQILHKGNVITLSIGEDEITKLCQTNDLTEDFIKEYLKNYDILLNKIKKVSDAKIVVIGLYENTYLDQTKTIIINSELANIAAKNEVIFINVADLLLNKDYFLNKSSYYFSYKGHEVIAEIIIHSI